MNTSQVMITHTMLEAGDPIDRNAIVNVTRGMLRERAAELALIDGRKPHEASKDDWEEAKFELLPR